MSYEHCIIKIEEALDGVISVEEMMDEIQTVSDAMSYAKRNGGSVQEAGQRVTNDLVRSVQRSAMIEQRNRYKKIVVKRELMAQIEDAAIAFKGDKKGLYYAVKSIIVGVHERFDGNQRSADAMGQALISEYYSALQARLRKEGVLTQYRWRMRPGSDFELQVAEAVRHKNTKDARGEPFRHGDLNDAEFRSAVKIGNAMADMQESLRQRLNRAGADIPKMNGFMGHQIHDDGKMFKAGFERWKKSNEGRMDWDKMKIDPARREAFLKSTYGALVKGVRKPETSRVKAIGFDAWVKEKGVKFTPIERVTSVSKKTGKKTTRPLSFTKWVKQEKNVTLKSLSDSKKETYRKQYEKLLGDSAKLRSRYKAEAASGTLAGAFKGPQNLARSVSHSRLLHFKDAKSWLEYSQEFGSGDFRSAILADMTTSAKNIGLMTRMGTNPELMLDEIIEGVSAKFGDDYAGVRYLQNNAKWLRADMDVVTGDINIGSHTTLAKVGEGYRALKTLALLGSSVLSAIPDIVFYAINRQYQGAGLFESYFEAIFAPLTNMNPQNRRIAADILGAGLDGQLGGAMARFSADDFLQGKTAGYMQTFFKINLLSQWTDGVASRATLMLSRDLALVSNLKFADLPDRKKNLLGIYSIDEKQWDVIRSAVGTAEDGRAYIMPGEIDKVSAPGKSQFQQRQLKEKARENLFLLYSNEASFAAPKPGAREQSIMKMGTTPDSPIGQALRMATQFKAFPVTATTKVMGRQVYGGGSAWMMSQLIVNTTLLGMAAVQLKEMAKGREPRKFDGKLLLDGMLHGGALGLYGDFLLNKHNEYGGTITETMAGPFFGDLAQVANIGQNALWGETDRIGPDMVRLGKGVFPGASLFYTRIVFDYMITNSFNEALSPGYLSRAERNLKNRSGQGYWASIAGEAAF